MDLVWRVLQGKVLVLADPLLEAEAVVLDACKCSESVVLSAVNLGTVDKLLLSGVGVVIVDVEIVEVNGAEVTTTVVSVDADVGTVLLDAALCFPLKVLERAPPVCMHVIFNQVILCLATYILTKHFVHQ